MFLYEVETTKEFDNWLKKLKDPLARGAIANRVFRIRTQGNFGDFKNLGAGLFELRFMQRSGYRIYYTIQNKKIVFLLSGGNKTSQDRDIAKARELVYGNR